MAPNHHSKTPNSKQDDYSNNDKPLQRNETKAEQVMTETSGLMAIVDCNNCNRSNKQHSNITKKKTKKTKTKMKKQSKKEKRKVQDTNEHDKREEANKESDDCDQFTSTKKRRRLNDIFETPRSKKSTSKNGSDEEKHHHDDDVDEEEEDEDLLLAAAAWASGGDSKSEGVPKLMMHQTDNEGKNSSRHSTTSTAQSQDSNNSNHPPPPSPMSLHITQLPFDSNELDLRKLLSERRCAVTSVRLVFDRDSRGHKTVFRGVAFVDMANVESYNRALTLHHTATIRGRKLNIRPTRSKEELANIVSRTKELIQEKIRQQKETRVESSSSSSRKVHATIVKGKSKKEYSTEEKNNKSEEIHVQAKDDAAKSDSKKKKGRKVDADGKPVAMTKKERNRRAAIIMGLKRKRPGTKK